MAEWAYNPITGNLDRIGQGGGGGGNITISGDSGPPLNADTFSIVGQDAGSAPMVTVDTSTGDVVIANNGWETPYVVDTSVVTGLKGTFSTIQSALDAAVVDGMTYTNPKLILLRNAAYTENLTIPGGAYFRGCAIMGGPSQYIIPVSITGNHTLPDVSTFYSNGVLWITTSGDMFNGGATVCIVQTLNSIFECLAGKFFTIGGTFGLECFTTQFIGDGGNTEQLTFNNIANFFDCDLGSTLTSSTTIPRYYNCTSVGAHNLSTGTLFAFDTQFTAGNANQANIVQTAGQPMVLSNCNFANNNPTYAIDSPIQAQIVNCFTQTNLGSLQGLLSPASTTGQVMSTIGNVLNGIRTDIDVITSGWEAYLGVTDTTAPRAITIRPSWKDYQLYVVDESGTAGTNNITIDVSGGGLINGSASLVISSNFGAYLLHQINTTDFIAISVNSASGGGAISGTPEMLSRFNSGGNGIEDSGWIANASNQLVGPATGGFTAPDLTLKNDANGLATGLYYRGTGQWGFASAGNETGIMDGTSFQWMAKIWSITTDTNVSSAIIAFNAQHSLSGGNVGSDGIGVRYRASLPDDSGSSRTAGDLVMEYQEAATATRKGRFRLLADNAGSLTEVFNAGLYQSQFFKGIAINRVATAVSYAVLVSNYLIGVTNTAAARTITLPAPMATGMVAGQQFVIKDESLAAGTNNITIVATSATIDGQASVLISINGGSITVYSDGTNYFTM